LILNNKLSLNITQVQDKIRSGLLKSALRDINEALALNPDHPSALYLAAVCKRYQKDFEAAGNILKALKISSPDVGRVFQEQGHLYLTQKLYRLALDAFNVACIENSALIASWRAKAELHEKLKEYKLAREARLQYRYISSLPKPLLATMDLIAQNKWLKAEKRCRSFLISNQKNVEGMRLLASIGSYFGALEESEFLLESAINFEPNNVRVRIDYVHLLRQKQKFTKALEQAEKLLETEPANLQFMSVCAIENAQVDNHERALSLFNCVLENQPIDPITLTSKGHLMRTNGQQEEAIKNYRKALRNCPSHCEAFYALSNLKTYKFLENEIMAMRQQEKSDALTIQNRIYLYFGLAKAFEDLKNYDLSFDYYNKGNLLKKRKSGYDSDKMAEDLGAQKKFFTPDLFRCKDGFGCNKRDPIFIVGLPRAGSTLLEQILSSHSEVDGTLELPNILSLTQKLRLMRRDGVQPGYPEIISKISPDELRVFGENYIEETRIHRGEAPFFTDKMPNNFRHIGLIQLILPNAKIIDARRHPMACCFSGFKQLFAQGQEFTYGLEEIGRYYSDYVALMDHWEHVLPEKILRVDYEAVVEDLEFQVRRILAHCDLPFEQSCLDFHRTERSVRTASSEQVRQPIYKGGLEQWRKFEEFLGPLEKVLRPFL